MKGRISGKVQSKGMAAELSTSKSLQFAIKKQKYCKKFIGTEADF